MCMWQRVSARISKYILVPVTCEKYSLKSQILGENSLSNIFLTGFL